MAYANRRSLTTVLSSVTSNDAITWFSVVVHAYVVLFWIAPTDNAVLSVLETATGIVFLTFVPGVLVLGLLGADLDELPMFVFTVGTSFCVLMAFGFVLNTLFLNLPILPGQPFESTVLRGSLLAMTLGLTATFRVSSRQPTLPPVRRYFKELCTNRCLVFAGLLPVLASAGAVSLNKTGANQGVLLVLGLVALVPLGVVMFDVDPRYYPAILGLSALALLLQNSLVLNGLQSGDAVREFYNANLVLTHDVWNTAFPTTKNGMLRVVILHPLYTEFTSLSLFWEFKIVHPLVFSTVAVSMYLFCIKIFPRRLAFFSIFLFISFHTFYTTYSQNTRSGTAILFVTMVILLLVQNDRRDSLTVPLILLFSFGIVVSHYGISILFAGVLSAACVGRILLRWWQGEPPFQFSLLGVVFFYWIVLVAWSVRAASGRVFEILVSAAIAVVIAFQQILVAESVGRRAISTTPSSLTHRYIQYEFLLIVGLVGVGLFLSTLAFTRFDGVVPTGLRERLVKSNHWSFSLSVSATAIVALAFSPISFFGIGRFWTIAMVFLLPYAFVPVWVVTDKLSRRHVHLAVSIILAVTLLVNAGGIATILDERSTQPNINREGIVEDGSQKAVFELYNQHVPAADRAATEWALTHRSEDTTIYGPGPDTAFPSHLFVTEYSRFVPPGGYSVYTGQTMTDNSYFFVNAYTIESGRFHARARGGIGLDVRSNSIAIDNLPINRRGRIYTAGNAELYGPRNSDN